MGGYGEGWIYGMLMGIQKTVRCQLNFWGRRALTLFVNVRKAKGHNAVQRISNRYAVDTVAVSIAYGGHCCQKGVVIADDARWGACTKILP